MKEEIKVPSVGESITTGVIVTWLKRSGDSVQDGDILFELETDKAVLEIPSTGSGTLEILVDEGTEVTIGQTVAMLGDGDAAAKPLAAAEPEAAASEDQERDSKALSPAVRRVVAEHNLDPSAIAGTGKGGRITKEDALRAAEQQETSAHAAEEAAPPAPAAPAPAPSPPPAPAPPAAAPSGVAPKGQAGGQRRSERVPMSAQFEKEHGIKIGFMSFFVKACCQALKEFACVNTEIDGTDIIYKYFYDIGVAVSIEEGLIVPNIRGADKLHFAEIEAMIASLAQRAHDKRLLPDELTGGTFTITNGGIFGSLLSTPIPAFPQTAILGMHAIKKRPVAIDDKIVIRPMMYVALTYDHRRNSLSNRTSCCWRCRSGLADGEMYEY